MPERITIESASGLQAALADPRSRMAVMKHIAAHPEKAMTYGSHEGRDILDCLLALLGEDAPLAEFRFLLLCTVCAISDPRVVQAAMAEICTPADDRSVAACTARLAQEQGDERVRAFLLEVAMGDPLSAQARSAATILASWGFDPSALPPEQWLRLSLLSDLGQPAPPPLTEDTRAAWMAELHGPRAERARQYLLLRGAAGWPGLKACWDDLSVESRVWALRWGRRVCPDDLELVDRALGSDGPALLLEALEGVQGRRPAEATRLASHPDGRVQAAAVRAGARVDLQDLAQRAATAEARRSALTRLAAERSDPVPALARACEDAHWTVRALAARLLVQRGGSQVVEAMRPLARHARTEVKVAAARVLADLGDEGWLESEVLS